MSCTTGVAKITRHDSIGFSSEDAFLYGPVVDTLCHDLKLIRMSDVEKCWMGHDTLPETTPTFSQNLRKILVPSTLPHRRTELSPRAPAQHQWILLVLRTFLPHFLRVPLTNTLPGLSDFLLKHHFARGAELLQQRWLENSLAVSRLLKIGVEPEVLDFVLDSTRSWSIMINDDDIRKADNRARPTDDVRQTRVIRFARPGEAPPVSTSANEVNVAINRHYSGALVTFLAAAGRPQRKVKVKFVGGHQSKRDCSKDSQYNSLG